MALKLSGAEIKQALTDVSRWKAKASAVAVKGEKITERVVRTVEVSAAGFGLGIIKGKWGPNVSLWGVPVDLILGVGLHAAGYAGIAGKASDHLHAFGDGALAVWFSGLGAGVGQKIGSGTPGAHGIGAGDTVAPPDDAALARMAAGVQ